MIHGRTKLNPCADNIAAFSLEFCVVNSNFHTRIGVAYVIRAPKRKGEERFSQIFTQKFLKVHLVLAQK